MSEVDVACCIELMRENMKLLHACTGGTMGAWDVASEKEFIRHLQEPTSRVLVVRAAAEAGAETDEWVLVQGLDAEDTLLDVHAEGRNLGFLHVQLTAERGVPSLVVLEMQLVAELRGKGVGKHFMEVVQSIATKLNLNLVLFNQFKANAKAMALYNQQQQLR